MSHTDSAGTADAAAAAPAPAARRIAFERLRERSDELELLISGLLAITLLTVPSRLFASWAGNEIHAEGMLSYGLYFGFTVIVGLCYSLGTAFVIHLAVRGYWVALVGLKSSFPDGIRWERLPLVGPMSRAFYREAIGDLGDVIDRVDRTASVLFATTILVALAIAWTGLLGVTLLVPAALAGLLFDNSQRATVIGFAVLNGLLILISTGIPLLDRRVARREAAGQPAQGLRRVVRGMLRLLGAVSPQRLIAPVQHTLQSNLGSRGFTIMYFVVPMAAMLVGAAHVVGSINFTLLNGYRVLTSEAVEQGMLSAHYESMRGPDDTLLRYPMIPSDRIEDTPLRLFIPHRPRMDNPVAGEACPALQDGRNVATGQAAAQQATHCLAALWTVTLDGKPVPLDGFLPMERRDLGMRGLMGYVDLQGLPPGRHDLRLIWNASGEESGMLRRREYRVPFWYAPEKD